MSESADRALSILHVISGLDHGGAERMLLRVTRRGGARLRHEVVSLTAGGALRPKFRELDVPVRDLGLRRPPSPLRLAGFARLVRRRRPDVVQGWLYDGNLAAALSRLPGTGRPPLAWNVRHSLHDLARERTVTRITVRLGAALSRLPSAIVYNARSSARQHEELGFRAERRVIIPNGFDTERFRPRPEARGRLLGELGLATEPGDERPLLVGTVGRDHPMKNHAGLLEAVAQAATAPLPHLVLVGPGLHADHEDLPATARRLGLEGRVHLLGAREDVPRILAGLDLFVLPSAYGESFPNALGEAMACGLPCVATDVGDTRTLMGEAGEIVPPEDPEALGGALSRLLSLAPDRRRQMGEEARRRIRRRYPLDAAVRSYTELWSSLAAAEARAA